METLIKNQRDYFNTNETKPVPFRIRALNNLRDLLRNHEDEINDAIHTDYKKSEFDSFLSEFLVVYEDIDSAIGNLGKWARRKRVRTNLLNWPARSYILQEPLGVTLVIGAWN